MHVYFSGIGGTGIGPLALIAYRAGFEVSGSDKSDSSYIEYLKNHGLTNIHIGQTSENISLVHAENPIDWIVYSSAVPKENPDHPELIFGQENGIRSSKRDEFLSYFIQDKNLKMIAVAGTHGKTTTTAMTIWAFKQLGIPISYSIGGKLSFGDMGEFDPKSEYFVYEADEYDRNFLSFKPSLAIISGIAYDHPDIYPTIDEYNQAFVDFISKCDKVTIWNNDAEKLLINGSENIKILNSRGESKGIDLVGSVNRQNAVIVASALDWLDIAKQTELEQILSNFPGVSRRFEKISENVYSDYAHTPEKILGALQTAKEVAGDNVVVVYEGLHNTRQHFIIEQLANLFEGVKQLYVVPSYLAREDESLELLTPEKLCTIMKVPNARIPSGLDETLKYAIDEHVKNGDLVLCLTAGGGGSLDEWLREQDFRS